MPKTNRKNVPSPEYLLPEILTIGEMIEKAFGDPNRNIVYFKLIRIILVILARQLKLLQRQVRIELPEETITYASSSSLSISEVKIHAKVKKKRQLTKAHTSSVATKERASRVKTKGESVSGAQKESSAKARHELGTEGFHTTNEGKTSKSAYETMSSTRAEYRSQTSGRIGDKVSTASALGSQKLDLSRPVKIESPKPIHKSLFMKSKHKSHSSTYTSGTDKTKDRSSTKHIYSDISVSHEQKTASSIRKKTDSHGQAEIDTDMEDQYEKLLVVETVPIKEAKARAGRLQGETRGKAPQLSIVTKEEFLQLAADVRNLQAKLDPTGLTDYPEKFHFLLELRKGASFTDALTALQLSARLEASERALERLTTLVIELAKRNPNISLTELFQQVEPEAKVLFYGEAPVQSSHTPLHLSTKSAAFKPRSEIRVISQDSMPSQMSILDTDSLRTFSSQSQNVVHSPAEEEENKDWITEDDLQHAFEDVYESVFNSVVGVVDKTLMHSGTAIQIARKLDVKLDVSIDVHDSMKDLEGEVAKYAEKINILDTGLSLKMGTYQDQICHMQDIIELTIENLPAAIAKNKNPEAIAELGTNLYNMQGNFEPIYLKQIELQEAQFDFSIELDDARKKIEVLCEIKSDREELAEALKGKVGYATLNGFIYMKQFYAVIGDFEQKINFAYDKFNIRELIWQKAIDKLLSSLDGKADIMQVISVKNDIKYNVKMLRKGVHAMLQIVGEPHITTFTRKMKRDSNCLSCSTPAHITAAKVPGLPYLSGVKPTAGTADLIQKNEEDNCKVCFPGLPIPHSRDARAKVCRAYCGGPTKLPATLSRVPPGILIKPAAGLDTVDKKADGRNSKMPCIPCNSPQPDKSSKKSSQMITEDVVVQTDVNSSVIPTEFRRRS